MTSPERELADRLVLYLRVQKFAPGERIGAERGLAEQFGVTRSELRSALEILEERGDIRRTMGRTGGVFSWDGKVERHLNSIHGVPELLRQQGFRHSTTVLQSRVAVAEPVERRALNLAEGDVVFHLQRRRDADGVPLSLDSMTIPLRLAPGFQDLSHTGSVYQALLEKYGIEAANANETIDVAAATATQALILQVPEAAPLLEIRRVTYSQEGLPFELAHDFFVADRTRITLNRTGARWKRVRANIPESGQVRIL
jgi:GntR family transcriptional regulator